MSKKQQCSDFNLFNTKPDKEYDPEQLISGIEVEKEHTNDENIAKCIAKHHLDEFADYYIELEKMEDKLKDKKRNE